MKKYIILIFFIISIILIQGCDVITFKDYGYKRVFAKYKGGEFEGSLIGIDEKVEDNLTIRGKKYDLNLFFTSIDMHKTNIFIQRIQLFSLSKKLIFEAKNKKIIFKVSEYSKKNMAFVFFKDINLPIEKYSDLLLIVDFSIEEVEKLFKIEQLFIRNPKEEKISFWDKLMGV